MMLARLAARIRFVIPEGRALPDEMWNRRHRGIVAPRAPTTSVRSVSPAV